MARTTVSDVNQIMSVDISEETYVDAYINVATDMVDEVDALGELDSTRLVQIETWLTAHLITITRERMGKQEKLGDASITYTGAFGAGLDSTPFGQMVKQLDTTGLLASKGKKKITFKSATSFDD